MSTRAPRQLTGRGVLVIALAAFGVVIAVNVTLMVLATGTFSGLVVRNSYVASQDFDRARTAQEALGWDAAVTYDGDALRLDLIDADGEVVRPSSLAITVGRPTTEREDRALDLVETPAGFAAPLSLSPGAWRVEVAARAADGTDFYQRRVLRVRPDP